MHFPKLTGLIRWPTSQRGRGSDQNNAAPSPSEFAVTRPQSAARQTRPSPEGFYFPERGLSLRIANPDLPGPASKPRMDIDKPLPDLPSPHQSQSLSPTTPLSMRTSTRTGSPEASLFRQDLMWSQPATPIEPGLHEQPVLRVMNPDPPSPRSASPEPESTASGSGSHAMPFTNYSRPFGPNNPFPTRSNTPAIPIHAQGTIPYRPGHDIHSPLYMGPPVSLMPRQAYTRIAPPDIPRPRPPLQIVIPVAMRTDGTPAELHFPRPHAPGPDHPRNDPAIRLMTARQQAQQHGVPVSPPSDNATPANSPTHSPNRSPARSRRNTGPLTVMPTIAERSETPVPITRLTPRPSPHRKPPPVWDGSLEAQSVPAPAPRSSRMPKGLRWLDFRTWGKSKEA